MPDDLGKDDDHLVVMRLRKIYLSENERKINAKKFVNQ